jgi:SEC-C motif-containing protein
MPARDDPATAGGCPCGLGEPYGNCCGRFHRGDTPAPTAEALMRSRFSAFAVGDEAYLLRTWHPAARPRGPLGLDPEQRWSGLEIIGRGGGGLFDAEGTVEFVAHYTWRGRPDALRENSRFVRDGGHWLYAGPITT